MKEIVYVNSGEVKSGNNNIILNSGAIGSCIVVTAYNSKRRVGAMAHILLPGAAPLSENKNSVIIQSRYAINALHDLFEWFSLQQINYNEMETCLIGGANVLERKDDSIGMDIYNSVIEILEKIKVKVCAETIGGYERRTAIFNIEDGNVYYTKGGSNEQLLWETAY